MRIHLPCAAIVLLGLLAADSARALVGGRPLDGAPDLVRLVFKDETMCTGFYLDENTILTAAHCLGPVAKILSAGDQPLPVVVVAQFPHPEYARQYWPTRDLGILKTLKNGAFRGDFKRATENPGPIAKARVYGTGIVTLEPKLRARSVGENLFFRAGAVLVAFGLSKPTADFFGPYASVSMNDSGAPIADPDTGKVIGIATQSTAETSLPKGLPVISVATSIVEEANRLFITSHLGPAL